jgi:hypothetical protein
VFFYNGKASISLVMQIILIVVISALLPIAWIMADFRGSALRRRVIERERKRLARIAAGHEILYETSK